MGLTIHYELKTQLTAVKDVRRFVEAIRQFALDLPFKQVGEVQEFQGKDTDFHTSTDEVEKWLKIQAGGRGVISDPNFPVEASHVIAVWTWPGEGCEAANFGFCRYPRTILIEDLDGRRRRRVRTTLDGWSWQSFCKTQYASDPRFGGVRHFLRCHLLVVKMLDYIKATGLATVTVNDEGEYWDGRNLEALAREVGDWNQFIAGFTSDLRSRTNEPGLLEAVISGFPTYEHLEAKGLDRLSELRKRHHADLGDFTSPPLGAGESNRP